MSFLHINVFYAHRGEPPPHTTHCCYNYSRAIRNSYLLCLRAHRLAHCTIIRRELSLAILRLLNEILLTFSVDFYEI
jgi:hypothetical protein